MVEWELVYVSATRWQVKASCLIGRDHEVLRCGPVVAAVVVCETHQAFAKTRASCGSTVMV